MCVGAGCAWVLDVHACCLSIHAGTQGREHGPWLCIGADSTFGTLADQGISRDEDVNSQQGTGWQEWTLLKPTAS